MFKLIKKFRLNTLLFIVISFLIFSNAPNSAHGVSQQNLLDVKTSYNYHINLALGTASFTESSDAKPKQRRDDYFFIICPSIYYSLTDEIAVGLDYLMIEEELELNPGMYNSVKSLGIFTQYNFYLTNKKKENISLKAGLMYNLINTSIVYTYESRSGRDYLAAVEIYDKDFTFMLELAFDYYIFHNKSIRFAVFNDLFPSIGLVNRDNFKEIEAFKKVNSFSLFGAKIGLTFHFNEL